MPYKVEQKMMTVLKITLAIFVAVCAVALFTVAWVLALTSGDKATDVSGLPAMTIHLPLYWLLVAVMLSAVWWLSRRWLF